MGEERLNKSGNRRGMSEGSQRTAHQNSFKNKPKDKLREISELGHQAYREVSSVNKALADFAKESANGFVTVNGKEMPVRLAFIKKLEHMFFKCGNLKAGELYIKLLGEMPAEQLEMLNKNGITITVADNNHQKMMNDLQNANLN